MYMYIHINSYICTYLNIYNVYVYIYAYIHIQGRMSNDDKLEFTAKVTADLKAKMSLNKGEMSVLLVEMGTSVHICVYLYLYVYMYTNMFLF
jgi:hypothetical protein